MKKFFTIGVAVLLGVSLSFLGCEDKAEDEPSAAEKAATALAEKLGGADFATAEGATVTLKQSVTLSDEATVEAGVTLATDEYTLTVGTEKTLTVAGAVNVAGVLSVKGTLDVDADGAIEVQSGGEYILDGTTTGTLDGTITVKSGGKAYSFNDSRLGGAGFNVVEAGGKAYLGTSKDAAVAMIGEAGDSPVIIHTGGKLSFNNTDYVLDGTATVNGLSGGGDSQGTFMVGETGDTATNRRLTLRAGSVLTVPGTSTETKRILVVIVAAGKPGVFGEPASGDKAAAKIVLAAQGYIDFYAQGESNYTSPASGDINFYDSSSTKVTGNSLHNTTYTWDATLGSNAGGWKAESPAS
jgi:hypothetical protein